MGIGQRTTEGELLDVALEASRRAGQYLYKASRSKDDAQVKESIHSVVMPQDVRSQEIIEATILSYYSGATIIAEEAKVPLAPPRSNVWVVDPLDGTSYFARGLSTYSVAVGYLDEHGFIVGAVYCPDSDEMFWAQRGNGTFLNGKRIHVSDTKEPAVAILTFSHSILRTADKRRWVLEMLRRVRSIRGGGSCAQDLAHLACGRIDGLLAIRQSVWDYGPAGLLVCEAGGRITRLDGSPNRVHNFEEKTEDVIATNGHLHALLLSLIGGGEEDQA